MNAPTAPALSRWRAFGLCLILAISPFATVIASAEPADAETLRQQAVSQYISGATRELDAYRRQVSDAARPDNQQLWNEAKARLDECNRLVTNLKSADQEHFDRIKAAYERARDELERALRAAQKA
jgi:biopolymer transport protein ExbB/TolQ